MDPPTTDHGFAEVVEPAHLALGEFEGDGDDGIHSLAQQEVLEHARALLAAAAQVVEREVVAVAEQCALGALDDRAVVPAVEERDDHADVLRAAGRQARRVRGHDVLEFEGGGQHPLPWSPQQHGRCR